jgi:hypothetical protein
VAGSSGTPTTGAPTGTPGGGGTDPIGTPEEEPGECSEPGSCEGTLPSLEGGTPLDDSLQAAFDAVLSAPIVSASVDAVDAWPEASGSCPSFGDFEMYARTLNVGASLCEVWESMAPVLSAVMFAIWSWVGIRVLLSA